MTNSIATTALYVPLISRDIPGPLLRFIFFQDRGGLTYPNKIFVGLVKQIAAITQKILPLLVQMQSVTLL
jgi:hypothetical protein